MSVLGMLAWCAAAVSLWLGAREHDGAIARAYRWLAGAAALYCTGLIISQLVGGTLNPAPGLAFADLPPLLALAAMAVGIATLASAGREGEGSAAGGAGVSVLPGLADGYVMAVARSSSGGSPCSAASFTGRVNGQGRSCSPWFIRWPTWP